MTHSDALKRFNEQARDQATADCGEPSRLSSNLQQQAQEARELLDNAIELSNPRCALAEFVAAMHRLQRFTREALQIDSSSLEQPRRFRRGGTI